MLRIAAPLALALLLASPSRAAGLDCAQPKGPSARAICADPALRQQDQQMTAAYDRLAAEASAAGKKLVERDARERRAYIEERCRPSDSACLAAAYARALGSLVTFAAQPAGGILLPVERFKLGKSSLVTASPRLDSPAEPWAGAFEQAARDAADALKPGDAESDTVIFYHATYLAPDLAAVAFSVWNYPQGDGYQVAFNYLPAARRGLRASDLFQPGTVWSGFLSRRAFDGLQAQAQAGNWTLSAAGPGNLEKPIADPANWLIHPDGLWLYFAPGTVGPGEHEVLVPWADLKPYLLATPAFKLP